MMDASVHAPALIEDGAFVDDGALVECGAIIRRGAVIQSGVSVGRGTEVGYNSVLGTGVVVGVGNVIHNNVTIVGNTTIGDFNKIFPGASIGTIPQDLKYSGEVSYLIIGNRNIIRECCMFNPGTSGGGSKTVIGNDNLFMAYSHVAHDCIVGNFNIFANVATMGGHVEVDDHVNMGGLSAAHQFVKIGKGSMVAAGSILTQDLPPYCIAQGERAKIRSLNRVKMRKLMGRSDIDAVASFYKTLFQATRPIKDIVMEECAKNDNKEVSGICDFIMRSTRGIPFKVQGVYVDE